MFLCLCECITLKKNFDLVHMEYFVTSYTKYVVLKIGLYLVIMGKKHCLYDICRYYEKRYRFNKKNVVLTT